MDHKEVEDVEMYAKTQQQNIARQLESISKLFASKPPSLIHPTDNINCSREDVPGYEPIAEVAGLNLNNSQRHNLYINKGNTCAPEAK